MRAHSGLMAFCLCTGCAYRPDSFQDLRHGFTGQHLTLGCIDLSIDRRSDFPKGGSVLAYEFGNRCEHPAVIDLAAVRVIGRTTDHHMVDLIAFDPNHEIGSLLLDGGAVGGEAIEYRSASPLVDICVDAATIAHAPPAPWLCFSRASTTQPTETP
jgi:hypothetical protein